SLRWPTTHRKQDALSNGVEIKCSACNGTDEQIVKHPSRPNQRTIARCKVCGGKGRVKKAMADYVVRRSVPVFCTFHSGLGVAHITRRAEAPSICGHLANGAHAGNASRLRPPPCTRPQDPTSAG